MISFIFSAVAKIMLRFSTTHGPAINTRGLLPPIGMELTVTVFIVFSTKIAIFSGKVKKVKNRVLWNFEWTYPPSSLSDAREGSSAKG